jgi:hypothetical protein
MPVKFEMNLRLRRHRLLAEAREETILRNDEIVLKRIAGYHVSLISANSGRVPWLRQ